MSNGMLLKKEGGGFVHLVVFDSKLCASMIAREAPSECQVQNQNICKIGSLMEMSSLRRLDMSFNPLTNLDGLDQLPQLRHLSCYSCHIKDIEGVKGTTRLETLHLQQNSISHLIPAFAQMNKLKDVRLDRNKFTSAGIGNYLSSCSSLQRLDLSFNKLSSLEALNGLQCLQELRVSNNGITTLKPLTSLPALRELHAANNKLKNLDGVQQLWGLEILHAEHNSISQLVVPLSYSRQNKPLLLTTNAATSSSSSSSSAAAVAAAAEAIEVKGRQLAEVYLTGNSIKSVLGAETLGPLVEILDLSENRIDLTTDRDGGVADFFAPLLAMKNMQEVRVAGNPFCSKQEHVVVLVRLLKAKCSLLKAVDGLSLLPSRGAGESSSEKETMTKKKNAGVISSEEEGEELREQGFHTWDDASARGGGGASVSMSSKTGEATGDENDEEEADLENDSEDEEEADRRRRRRKRLEEAVKAQQEEVDGASSGGIKHPVLSLRDMKTMEQIQQMEGQFRDLLGVCKDMLANSVFLFEPKKQQDEEKPFVSSFASGGNFNNGSRGGGEDRKENVYTETRPALQQQQQQQQQQIKFSASLLKKKEGGGDVLVAKLPPVQAIAAAVAAVAVEQPLVEEAKMVAPPMVVIEEDEASQTPSHASSTKTHTSISSSVSSAAVSASASTSIANGKKTSHTNTHHTQSSLAKRQQQSALFGVGGGGVLPLGSGLTRHGTKIKGQTQPAPSNARALAQLSASTHAHTSVFFGAREDDEEEEEVKEEQGRKNSRQEQEVEGKEDEEEEEEEEAYSRTHSRASPRPISALSVGSTNSSRSNSGRVGAAAAIRSEAVSNTGVVFSLAQQLQQLRATPPSSPSSTSSSAAAAATAAPAPQSRPSSASGGRSAFSVAQTHVLDTRFVSRARAEENEEESDNLSVSSMHDLAQTQAKRVLPRSYSDPSVKHDNTVMAKQEHTHAFSDDEEDIDIVTPLHVEGLKQFSSNLGL